MADDIKLIEQANAALRDRLAISKELLDLNNRTASSKDEVYSKESMIAEQRQLAYETTQAQVDLMLQTTEQQESELARLQALGEERTVQNEQEMQMLEEILRMRSEEPALLDQTIQKLRAKAAAQEQSAENAEKERKFVEEEAAAWGKNLANAMGFKKQQDGILKKFMQSKNKVKALTSAMKAFVRQISLAQIGTKMMQSAFSVLTGVLGRLFGSRGGGGGGNNIHQFVKMTGHANTGLSKMAKSAGKLGKKLKVGFDEGAKAVGNLMDGVTGFMNMSTKSKKSLTTLTVKMMAFNVEAQLGAQVLDQLMTRWGQSARQAKKSMMSMFGAAKKLGIPISKYVEDFSEFAKQVPSDGRNIEKRFRQMAAAAKAVGLQVKTMLDLAKGFETFETATRGAAEMNQILGKAVFNNVELMKAANESPEKFADKMQEGLKRAGKSWNDLTIYQKKAMAKSAKMDIGEMEKLMGGAKGDAMTRVQKARKSVQNITGAVKAFNEALKRTKPPGGGGGGGDFWSKVLKEYNEITGGKFFRKLKIARGNLKDVIAAVARFIACWIRKIEKWFINAATSFIDAFSGAINWVGNLFGVDDLASKMRGWVEEIDGWGPVLIPVLGLVAGALVRIGGLALTLVGTFAKLTFAMGKGLLKGVAGLPAFFGKLGDRLGSVKAALLDPKGGNIFKRAATGLKAMLGHTDATSMAAKARRAQPVEIVGPMGLLGGVRVEDMGITNPTSMLKRGPKGVKLPGHMKLGQAGRFSRFRHGTWGGLKGAFRRDGTGLRGGWKTGRAAGIDRANMLHQVKQISKTPGGGVVGPQLRGALGTSAVGRNLGHVRSQVRGQVFQQGGRGHLIKEFKRLNPGKGSADALKAVRGGWTPPAGAAPANMVKMRAPSVPGGVGGPGGAWWNATRPQATMVKGGTGSFSAMNRTAETLAKTTQVQAQQSGLLARTAQAVKAVPGGASALKYGGGALKGLGVAGGAIGVGMGAYSIYESVAGDKVDWEGLTNGVYDTVAGLMMFVPGGQLIGGLMIGAKYLIDLANYSKEAKWTWQDMMNNMDGRTKQLLAQDAARAASIQNMDKTIKANIMSGTSISGKMERELDEDLANIPGIKQLKDIAGRGQKITDEQTMQMFSTDQGKGMGDLSRLQYDSGAMESYASASRGRAKNLRNFEHFQKQKAHAREKKLDKLLEEQKKMPALVEPLTKAENELMKQYQSEHLEKLNGLHNAAMESLKETDAYKDPVDVADHFEDGNRRTMRDAVSAVKRLNKGVMKKQAEFHAKNRIAQDRIMLDAGNLSDAMYDMIIKSDADNTKKWTRAHQIAMKKLVRKERAGSLTAAEKKKLAQFRGKAKVERAGASVTNWLGSTTMQDMGNLDFTGIETMGLSTDKGEVAYDGRILSTEKTAWGGSKYEAYDPSNKRHVEIMQRNIASGKVKFKESLVNTMSTDASHMIDIIQNEVFDGNKGIMKDGKFVDSETLATDVQKIVAEKTKGKGAKTADELNAIITAAVDQVTGGLDKLIDREGKKKVKSLEDRAQDFQDKGFKVSQEDIENFKSYKEALTNFIKFAEQGDLQTKLSPVIKAIDKLREAGSDEVAGKFYYGMATFFYHASHLKTAHGKAITKIGEALAGMTEKISPAQMALYGDAMQKMTTAPTGEGGKTAIAEAKHALEEWMKVEKHVKAFVNESREGAFFFKGGTIDQNVKAKMDVRLIVGGKDFGKATLEGLKATGALSTASPKPKIARADG